MFYIFLRALIRLFLKKPEIKGYDNLLSGGPSIIVANHSDSYGPICISVFFRKRTYPWVINEIMSFRRCPSYIENDFVIKELGLSRPFSLLAAFPIAMICVVLMNYLGAIPVFKRAKKSSFTIKKSIQYLMKGRDLLIFPENKELPCNGIFNGFDTGFFHLGPSLYKNSGLRLSFIPVALNQEDNIISIGKPVVYNPENPVRLERHRVISELENSIFMLYNGSVEKNP